MSMDLEKFGWDGLVIPTELNKIPENLPTVEHLKIMRPPQLMSGVEIYFPYSLFTNKEDKYIPAYIIGNKINSGGYASIIKARRAIFKPGKDTNTLQKAEHFADICIKTIPLNILPDEDTASPDSRHKTYLDEVNAILYEAYIQTLLTKTFSTYAMEHAVPKLYEVVACTKNNINTHIPEEIESIWIVMELLAGFTLEKYLHQTLKKFQYVQNDLLIIDILVQLCTYLHILQETLHFNHRDMKINNLFIRYHEPGWSNDLSGVPVFHTWKRNVDIILIDFGFSCIACGPGTPKPRSSLLSAGSWFRPEHDCMKYGRDLAQLIYSLHVHFPIQHYLSTKLCAFLHKSCTAETTNGSVPILSGIDVDGAAASGVPQFNEGIYKCLRDNSTDLKGCRPATFLAGLFSLNIHSSV